MWYPGNKDLKGSMDAVTAPLRAAGIPWMMTFGEERDGQAGGKDAPGGAGGGGRLKGRVRRTMDSQAGGLDWKGRAGG